MPDDTRLRRRGNSKPNVKKRGSTYTYFLYVIGPDGRRQQHSKGGFRTQREAEEARVAAAHAIGDRVVRQGRAHLLRRLPRRRVVAVPSAAVLEESTWHSYDRYLRLHVIPDLE